MAAAPAVRDLIITAFAAHAEKGRRRLSLKQVLKALYLAKMDLPDGNRIRDALPYYWYLSGPTSDLVYKEFTGMMAEGIVRRVPHSAYEMFSLAGGVGAPKHEGDAARAAERVRFHAAGFKSVDRMLRDVYKNAPYGFYTAYRLDFMPLLERHCDARIHYEGGADGTREMALEALTGAVVEIPAGAEFTRFRLAISSYARSLRVLLQDDGMYDEHVPRDIEAARRLCDMVWTAFAYHACIYRHDPYYESKVGRWRDRLDEHMGSLEAEAAAFEESVDRIPVRARYSKGTEEAIARSEGPEYASAKSYGASEYLRMIEGRC